MNNGHITSTPRMKKKAMNVNTNTITVNTDTKETAMNANTNTTTVNTDTKETAMNVSTNTTTVNTDTKETVMNSNTNTDTKETIMNSDTNTDMEKNTSTVEETDIHTNTEHAFRLKGKNSLEVNPGYFASKFVKKRGLAFFKGDGWYEWTKEGWAPLRKSILQSRIRDLLKKKVSSFRMPSSSKSQAPTMPAFEKVNMGTINEILRLMTIDCDRGDTLPQLDPDVIPLQNRILRWNAEKKDFDSAPYTQDDLIFSRLNAEYAPEADQTFFLGKLAEILPDAEDRRVVQEYMGAALFAENRTRKFALFQGEGGCGKSLLVKLLSGILTLDRTFDLDFKALRGNYAFSALTSQTLMTASEAVSEAFGNSAGIEFVKKAVGGDFFATSQKYRNAKFNHYGFYSLFIASNNTMRFKYDSRGDEFKDRLIPIIFNTHIENPDKTLADKLMQDHKSAILNWLLEGAKRVRANNWNIQLSPDQISRRDSIVEATRGVEIFAKNHIVESTGKLFATSEAYALFTKLHKSAGYEYLTEDAFRKRLAKTMALEYGATASNTIPLPHSDKTVRGYRGFKLVDPTAKKSTRKTADQPVKQIDNTTEPAKEN